MDKCHYYITSFMFFWKKLKIIAQIYCMRNFQLWPNHIDSCKSPEWRILTIHVACCSKLNYETSKSSSKKVKIIIRLDLMMFFLLNKIIIALEKITMFYWLAVLHANCLWCLENPSGVMTWQIKKMQWVMSDLRNKIDEKY